MVTNFAFNMTVVKNVVAVTLFSFMSVVYGTSTSDEIGNVCSIKTSKYPYCTCTTSGTAFYRIDCSNQNRLVMPSGIPNYVNYLSLRNNQISALKKEDFPDLFVLEILDLSRNKISTIEIGTFDKLFRLKTLKLNRNVLPKVESYFRQLSSLSLIDLSYNKVERITGDAFFTLPAITHISLTGNIMQCDCETRKLKQWLQQKTNVNMIDALCVNKGNQHIYNLGFNQFGGCTGQDLFSTNQRCYSCASSKSHRECLETERKLICDSSDPSDPFICFTKIHFTNNGLAIWKGCNSYRTCQENSRITNPATCYNSSGSLQCNFCCRGDYCNNGDIGHRTKIMNLNVTFELEADMKAGYNNPSSAAYQFFESSTTGEIDVKLAKQSKYGTFHTDLVSLSKPKITATFRVECTTATIITDKDVFDYTVSSLEALRSLGGNMVNTLEVNTNYICSAQTVTTSKGTFEWPATEAGYEAGVRCPANKQYAQRTCELVNGYGKWGSMNDSKCEEVSTSKPVITTTSSVTDDLTNLSKQTITDANADSIASDLLSLSTKASTFSDTDVNLTVSILEDLVKVPSTEQQSGRGDNIAKTMSNFLESPSIALSTAENEFKSPSRFLETVQTFTDNMNVESNDFTAVNPNLALFARKSTGTSFSGFAIQTDIKPGEDLKEGRVQLTEGTDTGAMGISSIVLPSTLASELTVNQRSALSKVSFAVYTNGKLFDAISKSSPKNNGKVSDNSFVTAPNSLIMSASIPNVEVKGLNGPILLKFKHDVKNSKNPQCSFWDENGNWSSEGCVVKEVINNEYTLCECDHLTNFALLMDIYGTGGGLSEENKRALSIISYIGCGISLFGLLLTITTYLLIKKLRVSNPSKILINLCIALAATNVVFLLGQQKYTLDSDIGCKVVAVLMHYFLLAAMTWMAVEAFYMYLALVKVFNTYISRFLLKSCLIGWGVPMIAVVITLGVNKTDNYGFQAGDICWLVPIAFYAAFLTPVLLILILNFISFVLVTRTLFGVTTQKLTKSDRSTTTARLRGAVSVVVLLGLTWVFAIFAVDGGGIIFQYLFTIFNSFQGLFIFIFYCALNKEAQRHWIRKIPCCASPDDKVTTQTSKEKKAIKYVSGFSSSQNETGSTVSTGGYSDADRPRKISDVALRYNENERKDSQNYPSYVGSSA